MPPLLTAAQRQQFNRFPKLDERLLARHYLLDTTDLKTVLTRRRDFNRLGYAVQLTVLGAETAMLGGLGSVPGAATAALVLSLVTGLGNEGRAGWGTFAAHAIVHRNPRTGLASAKNTGAPIAMAWPAWKSDAP